MIDRGIGDLANRLAGHVARCEQQCRMRCCMRGKGREHLPLIICAQMKETVPCQNGVELLIQRKAAHVGCDGPRLRDILCVKRCHRVGGIDTGHARAAVRQIAADRTPGTAAQIKNPQFAIAAGCRAEHPVKPRFLDQIDTTLLRPDFTDAFVCGNDIICFHRCQMPLAVIRHNGAIKSDRFAGIFRPKPAYRLLTITALTGISL